MDTNKDRGPFYCEVCDCEVKDSSTYLDHINGKKHNLNLGISLKKFKDCSLEEVKAMLSKKKLEREENQNKQDEEEGDEEEFGYDEEELEDEEEEE